MTIEFDMTVLQGSSCNHFWHWLPSRAAAAPGLRQFESSRRSHATSCLALCRGVSSPSKIGRGRTLRLGQHLRLYQRLVLHSPELADNPGRGAISGMAASQVYRNFAAPASAVAAVAAGTSVAAAVAAAKSAAAAGCLAAAAVTAAKSAVAVAAGCLAAAAVAAAKSAMAAAGCLAAAAVAAAKSAAADAAVAFAADATGAVEASARSRD
jgi:hypothetical protein